MKKRFWLVFLAWLVVCFLGALPFYVSGVMPNFTDAFFESVSGFTTTGATVLSDIEALPGWLLFWRSLTQWLGGFGILTLAAVMLPGIKADISKRIDHAAYIIVLLYIALTALQFVFLYIFGAGWFDAATLSFSTMSTGGFSVRNNGIAFYNSAKIEWVCAVFMFLSGINFSLVWLLFIGKAKNITRNSEAKAYAGITLVSVIIITFFLMRQNSANPVNPWDIESYWNFEKLSLSTSLRQAFFHAASFISTNGFYAADFNVWPYAAQGVLFFLLFVGGCSGSAAGGIKVIRHVILSKQTWNEMRRIIYPRGIFVIRIDDRGVDKKVVHGAAGFVFLYLMVIFLAALLVSSSGADIFTSLNAALVCQGNAGLGLGDFGAFKAFPDYPSYVKWGLSFVMIMGRFELWTVLVLFSSDFRRKRRSVNL